jgi:hypothetical protein
MLALWFSFWAIHIVQTDARQLRILPEVEKDEQINEEDSTLTLDCIVDKRYLSGATDPRWILPRSEVIKMNSINYSILNVVTRTRVLSSWKRNGVEDNQENYYKQ